jgi:hypothetical protein
MNFIHFNLLRKTSGEILVNKVSRSVHLSVRKNEYLAFKRFYGALLLILDYWALKSRPSLLASPADTILSR